MRLVSQLLKNGFAEVSLPRTSRRRGGCNDNSILINFGLFAHTISFLPRFFAIRRAVRLQSNSASCETYLHT
jgi:hypothetical protein